MRRATASACSAASRTLRTAPGAPPHSLPSSAVDRAACGSASGAIDDRAENAPEPPIAYIDTMCSTPESDQEVRPHVRACSGSDFDLEFPIEARIHQAGEIVLTCSATFSTRNSVENATPPISSGRVVDQQREIDRGIADLAEMLEQHRAPAASSNTARSPARRRRRPPRRRRPSARSASCRRPRCARSPARGRPPILITVADQLAPLVLATGSATRPRGSARRSRRRRCDR